jgi:hypothetical protein
VKTSVLGALSQKFDRTGVGSNPIITDQELKSLHTGLIECSRFMVDRNDKTMASALVAEADRVERMIEARRNE